MAITYTGKNFFRVSLNDDLQGQLKIFASKHSSAVKDATEHVAAAIRKDIFEGLMRGMVAGSKVKGVSRLSNLTAYNVREKGGLGKLWRHHGDPKNAVGRAYFTKRSYANQGRLLGQTLKYQQIRNISGAKIPAFKIGFLQSSAVTYGQKAQKGGSTMVTPKMQKYFGAIGIYGSPERRKILRQSGVAVYDKIKKRYNVPGSGNKSAGSQIKAPRREIFNTWYAQRKHFVTAKFQSSLDKAYMRHIYKKATA